MEVTDIVLNPADKTKGYVLWNSGTVLAFGGALPPPALEDQEPGDANDYASGKIPIWRWGWGGPAMAIQVIDWVEPSGYTMDAWGGVYAWGPNAAKPGAQHMAYPAMPWCFEDFVMDPIGNGQGYAMPFGGDLRPVGGAPDLPTIVAPGSGNGPGACECRVLAMDYATGRYYIMNTFGGIFAVNGAEPIVSLDLAATPNWWTGPHTGLYNGEVSWTAGFWYDVFRDLAILDYDTGDGWVLDAYGTIRALNGAQTVQGNVVFSGAQPVGRSNPLSSWPWAKWETLAVVDDGLGAGPLTFMAGSIIGERKLLVVSTPPTANVVKPDATETETTRPSIAWAYSDPEGDAQMEWKVRVFTDTQYGIGGFDPAVSPATWEKSGKGSTTASVFPTVDLVNDTYRAYVLVRDSSGLWSVAWDYIQWDQDVTPPPTPALTVTPGGALDGIALSAVVTGADSDVVVGFQYRDSTDDPWRWVRDADAVLNLSDLATAVDPEPAFGVTRTYRAKAYVPYPAMNGSPFSSEVTGKITELLWVLSAPESDLVEEVSVVPPFSTARPQTAGLFRPVGRRTAVVVTDGAPQEPTFTPTFRTLNRDIYDALLGLLDSDLTLLFRTPFGDAWYVRLGAGGPAFNLLKAAPLPEETTRIRHVYEIPVPFVTVKRPLAGPSTGDLALLD